MKTQYLLPILSITASLALRAQGPNDSPPPGKPQNSSQQNERRERFQKMAEQFREQRGKDGKFSDEDRREHFKKMAEHCREQRGSGGEGQSQERAEHIREAMKHLKAAGLGQMAERIEESLKKMHDERGRSPAAQSQDQPQRGPQQRGPFGGSQQFSRPAPLTPGAPAPMGNRGPRPNADNNDDLKNQVQRLAHQVEELRNMIQNRKGDSPDQRGSRGGERPEHRPEGKGPHHKHHDSKPESNPREEIKPAL